MQNLSLTKKYLLLSMFAILFIFPLCIVVNAETEILDTDLRIIRKEVNSKTISYNFKLRAIHNEANLRCVHILKLLPVALNSQIGRQREAKRVMETINSSRVSWKVVVPNAKRTALVRPQIHALVSSVCGEDVTNSQVVNSQVASRYACTNELSGIKISTHVRLIARNARVSKRSI